MKRDVIFGEIPGIEEGTIFNNNLDLAKSGIHTLRYQGIGSGGASIILNEGYVDDRDYGHEIIYTGHGGRDENSKKQIKDQSFTRFNLHLALNCDEGLPIRVCRGSKLKSPFATTTGFRYDGLYFIEKYWLGEGEDGFAICRFKLLKADRASNTPPAKDKKLKPSRRSTTTLSRLVRDSKESQKVKRYYDYKCQICEITLLTPFSKYAEGAHIHPVGEPHNGPDVSENILCLCPNCHVLFDKYAITILNDFTVKETGKKLLLHPSHRVDTKYLSYKRIISPLLKSS